MVGIKSNRVESIDILKGVVMILMALDHIRDYFHAYSFIYDPTDPTYTTIPIYFTRWITHFCAPAFAFLAGISAFFIGRKKSKKELRIFLIKRGLWLYQFNFKTPDINHFYFPFSSLNFPSISTAMQRKFVLKKKTII